MSISRWLSAHCCTKSTDGINRWRGGLPTGPKVAAEEEAPLEMLWCSLGNLSAPSYLLIVMTAVNRGQTALFAHQCAKRGPGVSLATGRKQPPDTLLFGHLK